MLPGESKCGWSRRADNTPDRFLYQLEFRNQFSFCEVEFQVVIEIINKYRYRTSVMWK